MLEGSPKLRAIDEETNHQIVQGSRFGKANRAAYEPLDPGPQIAMFALVGLRILFTNYVLFGGDMPLLRPPSIQSKSA